jgi:hypothetical protein
MLSVAIVPQEAKRRTITWAEAKGPTISRSTKDGLTISRPSDMPSVHG